MALPRRLLPLLSVLIVAFIFFGLYHSGYTNSDTFHHLPQQLKNLPQHVGLGDWSDAEGGDREQYLSKPDFHYGEAKPPGEEYTKLMVVARTKEEKIDWMDKEIPDMPRAVYTVNDPDSEYKTPKNKGHEVMVYLTHIIDNYDNLTDVTLFMHAHQFTWHNPDVLGNDAARMVKLLSMPRVQREGFMNIRCQWFPGCPDWMHPGETKVDKFRMEQTEMAKAWAELFPFDEVPSTLGTPCCSQFALSRDRIRTVPRHQFEHYRRWMLETSLPDFISGRVWEYLWQYVFTGKSVYCPDEIGCYCDGYGACFESSDAYQEFFDLRSKRNEINGKWLEWQDKFDKVKAAEDANDQEALVDLEKPEPGKNVEFQDQIEEIKDQMSAMADIALVRGQDPKVRAESVGRPWKEGDGF